MPITHHASRITYDIYFVGVGGQGVLTIGEIITETAYRKGLPVNFYPTKGMAQRGGFVKAQLRLGREAPGPAIPEKGADLVIATEVSEALKAVRFVKPEGRLRPLRARLGADRGDAGQGAVSQARRGGRDRARRAGRRQSLLRHPAGGIAPLRRRAGGRQHLHPGCRAGPDAAGRVAATGRGGSGGARALEARGGAKYAGVCGGVGVCTGVRNQESEARSQWQPGNQLPVSSFQLPAPTPQAHP